MQYTDLRTGLRINVSAQDLDIPTDQRVRLQDYTTDIERAVAEFPESELSLTVVRHGDGEPFNVAAKLRLPGETLFTGERDSYLDCALRHALHKLEHKIDAYKAQPHTEAIEQAEQRQEFQNDILAPEDTNAGELAMAVENGDYQAFRKQLEPWEDWLRLRVGRWVQRFPDAESRIGGGLKIGDIVEETFLNAFEHYSDRPNHQRLHEWLDDLIDPSLQDLMQHPSEARENTSFARTLRETDLPE